MLRAGCILTVTLSLLAVSASTCLAADISIQTSSEVYEIGDTVYFSVANQALRTVTFARDPIYSISDSTGFVVYPADHNEADITWEPGHSETFAWLQTSAGGKVPLGRYFVSVHYYPGDAGPAVTRADTFRIVTTGCTVDCATSWGHIKSLFR